jgi:hypothetical protein
MPNGHLAGYPVLHLRVMPSRISPVHTPPTCLTGISAYFAAGVPNERSEQVANVKRILLTILVIV